MQDCSYDVCDKNWFTMGYWAYQLYLILISFSDASSDRSRVELNVFPQTWPPDLPSLRHADDIIHGSVVSYHPHETTLHSLEHPDLFSRVVAVWRAWRVMMKRQRKEAMPLSEVLWVMAMAGSFELILIFAFDPLHSWSCLLWWFHFERHVGLGSFSSF